MNGKEQRNILAALDAGSSVTRVVVAELPAEAEDASELRYLGCGEAESRGWRKGSLTDPEALTECIRDAVDLAEKDSGAQVESVVVGLGGPHIQGALASCGVSISQLPRQVAHDDVRLVMESARDIPLSQDREILHMLPEEFALDSQKGIPDPVGMQGAYLAVKAHVITGSASASANLVTAVNRAGVLVETVVFEALAAAEEVLDQEERRLGALVMLLGGGSCEMVAYRNGGVCMAGVIPIGGDHFTNDLAFGLGTSLEHAEALKKDFGLVMSDQCKEGSVVEVPGEDGVPPRFVPYRALAEILESRAEELVGLVRDELRRDGLDRRLGAGVVMCGGGARLGGMCDLIEKMLRVPARVGLPPKIAGVPGDLDSPEYSTALGLLYYSKRLWTLRAAARERQPVSRLKRLIAGHR